MKTQDYYTPRVKELIRTINEDRKAMKALKSRITSAGAELIVILNAHKGTCSVVVDGTKYKATACDSRIASRVKIDKTAQLDDDYYRRVPNRKLLYKLIVEDKREIPGVTIGPGSPYVRIIKTKR